MSLLITNILRKFKCLRMLEIAYLAMVHRSIGINVNHVIEMEAGRK